MDQGSDQAAQMNICMRMLGWGVNEGKGRALTKRNGKIQGTRGRVGGGSRGEVGICRSHSIYLCYRRLNRARRLPTLVAMTTKFDPRLFFPSETLVAVAYLSL
jgi:hypothetical protein